MNLDNLKATFGDCSRTDNTKCRFKSSYELISLPLFFVFDNMDNEPVRIVSGEDDYQLEVKNDTKKEICFIKTDNCLFTDEHKKCDCILYNDTKIFLIEIKCSSPGTRGKKRKKAVLQLGNTINLLKHNNINLSTHETKAIICFKEGKTRPTQPSFNTQRAVFLEEYNISLEEGSKISF